MLLDSGAGDAATSPKPRRNHTALDCSSARWSASTARQPSKRSGPTSTDTKFTADQIRFINLIVNELTANGVMEPARLYESPYTDHTPTGPESVFAEADVDSIVDILNTVKANALPTDGAA